MENFKRKLVNYFKKNIVKGYTPDSLRFALMSQGYTRTAVETALETANRELAEKAPVLKDKPKITYEIIDQHNKPVKIKKSWWRSLFGL